MSGTSRPRRDGCRQINQHSIGNFLQSMSTLLHIDASPLGEASVSRHLSGEFVRKWQEANPTGKVITRDLTTSAIPPVDGSWVGAVYTPEESRSAAQKEVISLSDTLIAELEAAIALGEPASAY